MDSSWEAISMGSPGAGKPHTGQYGELTPWRQRGGAGSACPLPTIFSGVPDAVSSGATAHEKVGPSRDRKGAVEAICRVCPSLTVAARISAIFRSVTLKLASRLNRLGTETAFDVLVKAKALEAQGR